MESMVIMDKNFYKGKKILVTGHTGFKGSWMCKMLLELGANVSGVALLPPTNPALYDISGVDKEINSFIGDIRNCDFMMDVFKEVNPELVLHMAAQPIVLEGYKRPRETYETNVMGTVNVLECIRNTDSVRSFLNVTTDKVYKNEDLNKAFTEADELNGFDPYSNSKSCSELVTSSYKNSFFSKDNSVRISTARAGNVIGGGDFAADRIIPDCVRAAIAKKDIIIRNPYAIRPFQHVLEPLSAYLLIIQKQYEDNTFAGNYNIGPDESDCITTGELVDLFCKYWGDGLCAKVETNLEAPHEAGYLKLDSSKIKSKLNWKPKWNIDEAVKKTVEFTRCYHNKENIEDIMKKQIDYYINYNK